MNHKTYHPVFGSDAARYNMTENFRQAFPAGSKPDHFEHLRTAAIVCFWAAIAIVMIAVAAGWLR